MKIRAFSQNQDLHRYTVQCCQAVDSENRILIRPQHPIDLCAIGVKAIVLARPGIFRTEELIQFVFEILTVTLPVH